MSTVRVTRNTNADTATCWALLADFANIDFFSPQISKSYLLEDTEEIGVGTKRQCNIGDGKNYLREEVLEWKEGEFYVIDIFESTLPVKRAVTKFGTMPRASGGAMIYMEFTYDVKFGILGKIMDTLVMRHVMGRMLQSAVDGLGDKAELHLRQAA